MNSVESSALVHYTLHHQNIHHFTLREPTRAAFDALVNQLEQLFQTTSTDQKIRLLIDFRENVPPLSYAFQRGTGLFSRHPQQNTYYALLMAKGPLASISQSFFGMLPIQRPSKFFNDSEYDLAIDWLAAC